MSERRIVRICARPGEVFAPSALDGIIGDPFPLTLAGEAFGTAKCVEADVEEEGRSIVLVLEADRWPEGMVATFEASYDADDVSFANPPLPGLTLAEDPSCETCGHRRHAHGIPGIPSTFRFKPDANGSMAESPPCMATVNGDRCPCAKFVPEPW